MVFSKIKSIAICTLLCASSPCLISQGAQAAPKKGSIKTKAKKKGSKSKEPKIQPVDAGAEASEKSSPSKIELLVNAGISPSPFIGFGGTLGLMKDSGSGLESTLTFASGKSGTVSASVTHIGGRYRMGLMKLGYIAAGGGFRMASGKWFVLNTTQSDEYAAGASLNAVTLDAAVGGQIKFGSILVGADLFGISFPIFKLGVKKTIPTEPDYDEDDATSQQAKFDKIAAGMNLTLVKAGIGMEF
jgi:hypothetical protein